MVVRTYCDRCNLDITSEVKYYVHINLNGYERYFTFCKNCYREVYNHISKIVPKEIWDGSPDYPTKKEE